MKEYSGYDTKVNGLLIDDLQRTKDGSTLFVSHYFFALNDGKNLLFYYNPMYYWDKIPVEKVDDNVWLILEKECAVFRNFSPDKEYKKPEKDNRTICSNFYPETAKIGNHYHQLGNGILSHHGYFYIIGAWGGCSKIKTKDLTEYDLMHLIGMAVLTKTPNYIKSIYDLKCFKKPVTSNSNTIIGAVIGDVIGSVFEWNNIKTTDFSLFNPKCDFTDDTVLTIAVADSILNKKEFAKTIWEYGRKYRGRGYGGSFRNWLQEDNLKPYGSFGNGSAMRASAVGFAFDDIETVMEVAKQSAEVTHNHPEGIKGAQATATAIFLARQGKSKQEIKDYITRTFKYNLDFTLDEIRPTYKFDVTCQGSVPQAIVAFLESSDFESAIRLAISIGGDSDTIACITGGIASAYYKEIPTVIIDFVVDKLPSEYIEIMNKFDEKYDRK
ncbi:MAG TPA: ADP-ribosylglycohydrolase family protein [Edaphocola sp.]|nr:ADP-ribosylglycohydrolase family protein [Edaphocola sp.]